MSCSASITVAVLPLPTATVSGGDPSPDVSIALTGTAPWTVTYSIDGNDQTPVTGITVSPYVIAGAAPSIYTATALSDANCTGTFTSSATITSNVPLPTVTVSGGSGTSTPDQVTFTVTGTGPWSVTYTVNGQVQPTLTISSSSTTAVIDNATPVTYTVTAVSDANGAGTPTGTVTVNVTAPATVTVSGGSGTSTPDQVTFTVTGRGPWSVTYTVNGQVQPTLTISSSSTTAVIDNATPGTYTVTAVSDANGAGTPTGTVTITVPAAATAAMSGGGTACAGTTLPNVSIALTGTAPWVLTYTIDGNPTTVTANPGDPNPYIISGAAAGIYDITALSDANGAGTSFTGSATVTVNPLPTATVSGGGTVCAGANLPNVSIALTGSAPWALTYGINGIDQTPVTGITVNPYVITGAAAGIYTITALSDANCSATVFPGSTTVTVNPLPTATISGGGTVCEGTTLPNVSIALTGTAPWSLTYAINGVDQTPVTGIPANSYIITGAAAGIYTVSALSDANCTGNTLSTGSATVTVNPLPTANRKRWRNSVCQCKFT